MYVDASALVAILLGEPDGPELLARIEKSPSRFTSIVTKVEVALAFGRAMKNVERSAELVDALLNEIKVKVEPVTPDMYTGIMEAAARYGKGTGHPVKLNFGDCFSYAMAKRANVPLLYKGNDFAKTDLAAK